MPDLRISELPVVQTASGDSWIVVVVNGVTSKIRKVDLLGS